MRRARRAEEARETKQPMTTDKDRAPVAGPLTVDAAIRIGLLGLLLYSLLDVIGPFVSIALWSAILTVALYPLYDWLARRIGSRRLAAVAITLLCLMIVVGPVTWLGMGLIGTVDSPSGNRTRTFRSFRCPLIPSRAGR